MNKVIELTQEDRVMLSCALWARERECKELIDRAKYCSPGVRADSEKFWREELEGVLATRKRLGL